MSRQFDVFANPVRTGRGDRPFVLDIQHSFLSSLATRLVVPLVTTNALPGIPRLMPPVEVDGRTLFLSPTEIAIISSRQLRSPVASLEMYRERIIAALDLVFTCT